MDYRQSNAPSRPFDRSQLELPGDYMPRPHGNCYWVAPGRVMAGEYPRALDQSMSRTKLAAIVNSGIRQFIDLTEPTEGLGEYETLLRSISTEQQIDVRHSRLAIRDLATPSRQHMKAILEEIASAVDGDRPVYVHCWGGIGRTGTVVGCLLVESGFKPEEAIELIAKKWTVMEKSARRHQSPETPEQFAFIRSWR